MYKPLISNKVSWNKISKVLTNVTLQLRIEARDGGTPALSATALVDITVQRNLFTPSFTNLTYETTILETQAIGTTVIRLLATDQDSNRPHNVTSFAMIDNNNNNFARNFFFVESNTGAITIRQSLLNDQTSTSRFQVKYKQFMV